MKKTVLMIVLMLGLTTFIFSQKRGEMSPRMAEELKLTQEQKDKLKEIREMHRKDFQALRDKRLTVDERHAEMKALREQMKEDVNSVLTEEQIAVWEKNRHREFEKRRFEHRMDRKKEMGSFLYDLDLDEKQREQIRSIMTSHRPKMKEIKDSQLSEEEKRHELEALRDQTHAELEKILTPEQFEVLQKRLEERRHGPRHDRMRKHGGRGQKF